MGKQCQLWGKLSCYHSPHWIIVRLKDTFSFRFLNCNIGQHSRPVFVKLGPTLERVPSICRSRQENSLRRGMEGTLGLRALSIPLKGWGITQSVGLWVSLGGEAVSTREAVKAYCVCTHCC